MKEKSWEFVGRTVDEALETALEELGLERDDVHVEILEEPQKSFLGLGGKEARIRVELIGEWEVLGARAQEQPQSDSAKPVKAQVDGEARGGRPPSEMEAPTGLAVMPARMVEEILGIMGIDAMVEAKEKEDAVVVDVWGDEVGILIGKNGNTLEAMQYLVNVSCRRTGEVTKRIVIDVEGYRKRRKARLEKQAEEMANQAVSQGRSIEMPPMSPSERKIVHMALRRIGGVYTESLGEEPERRVVIHPNGQGST
jgi:spoIIIJ-associated protein